MKKFNCTLCGYCCRNILINVDDNLSVGLCLRPEERKIFNEYPDTDIKPYIGLERKGSQEIKVICYQMITEPCPLLNVKTNRCTDYENRPMICREYPFTPMENGVTVESNCSSIKSQFKDIEFGKTEIIMNQDIKNALANQYTFFINISNELLKDNKLRAYIYDFNNDVWLSK